MNKATAVEEAIPALLCPAKTSTARRVTVGCFLAMVLAAGSVAAQVITVDTKTGVVTNSTNGQPGTTDRRYQQIQPTHVPFSKTELDAKTRLDLIRALNSEQGFAMRPFPRGHKGLTLAANGKLDPAGDRYLSMIIAEGVSAKPGDRLVLTDVKIEKNHIVFELNGGPEGKHRFLRHIQVGGVGPTAPIVRDADQEPMGARLTLTFENRVPELSGADVKALLAPLISFDVKTPIQAFTDTLPDKLKDAILGHQVLVGMSTEMVIFAKGQPETKFHEMEGNMPFDEWIYGKAPKDVEFVRFNGNRVIRLEIAKMGKAPAIFTKDEVDGLMRTDGTPLLPAAEPRAIEQVGDVERNPDTQAPAAPPTLAGPGEKMPGDDQREGQMRPVIFPKAKPVPQPGANPDGEPDAQPPASSSAPARAQQPAPGADASQPKSSAPQPQPQPQPAPAASQSN